MEKMLPKHPYSLNKRGVQSPCITKMYLSHRPIDNIDN